jgi:predicted ABC-type sugar transport system permease subunit
MNVVDKSSTIGLLRLLHHLAVVGGVGGVARKTTVGSRHCRSWSINSVGLCGHCWVILIGTIDDVVSSLMAMKACFAIIGDLTDAVLLGLAISLILISCLGLI